MVLARTQRHALGFCRARRGIGRRDCGLLCRRLLLRGFAQLVGGLREKGDHLHELRGGQHQAAYGFAPLVLGAGVNRQCVQVQFDDRTRDLNAVIWTNDVVAIDFAERQRRTAVRTVVLNDLQLARTVPPEDEIAIETLQSDRPVGDIARRRLK